MSNTLNKYKGFVGSIEHDLEEGILFGKVLFINDLINYEGTTLPELQSSFKAAVDSYLELCAEAGLEPDKPMTGSFNIRITPECHRQLAIEAARRGVKINAVVKTAIERYLQGGPSQHVTHTHEHIVKIESSTEAEGSFGTKGVSQWSIENSSTLLN